jgi:hypothetical protein
MMTHCLIPFSSSFSFFCPFSFCLFSSFFSYHQIHCCCLVLFVELLLVLVFAIVKYSLAIFQYLIEMGVHQNLLIHYGWLASFMEPKDFVVIRDSL